jgi:PilZ domain
MGCTAGRTALQSRRGAADDRSDGPRTEPARGNEEAGMAAGMAAGTPGIDFPGDSAGLSVLPLGAEVALTSRVRRARDGRLLISVPRDGAGRPAVLVERDLIELSWQAQDGLRSVAAEVLALTAESLWKVRVRGAVTRTQRRDRVRAPIGLPVHLHWGRVELAGSTVDLSEGGLLCVFRSSEDLGTHTAAPTRGHRMPLTLDFYSDVLSTEVELISRRPRPDHLHEWSLRFAALPEPAEDLIRSHVFTALRNARARSIAALY